MIEFDSFVYRFTLLDLNRHNHTYIQHKQLKAKEPKSSAIFSKLRLNLAIQKSLPNSFIETIQISKLHSNIYTQVLAKNNEKCNFYTQLSCMRITLQ